MPVSKRPACAKKCVKVNPVIKKVVIRKKLRTILKLYKITTLCPPQRCPKCGFSPVFADAFGSYHCPRPGCGYTFNCSTCAIS